MILTPFLSIMKLSLLCAYLLSFAKEAATNTGNAISTDYQEYLQPEFDNMLTDVEDAPFGLTKRSKLKTCGRFLTIRLQGLCNGVYKRGPILEMDDHVKDPKQHISSELEQILSPYIARHTALSLKPPYMRKKRDVVEECCRKSCSDHYMKVSYCGQRND